MADTTKAARPEPRLSTDYCGELYIVIDDDGEPVSLYCSDPNTAHRVRNGLNPALRFYRVTYRIIDENPVVHDDGGESSASSPVADEHERVRQDGYNAGYGDALRDEYRRETEEG